MKFYFSPNIYIDEYLDNISLNITLIIKSKEKKFRKIMKHKYENLETRSDLFGSPSIESERLKMCNVKFKLRFRMVHEVRGANPPQT